MVDAMQLINDIWNNLSPEGRRLWIEEGQVLPKLKNGKYAAKDKQPNKQSKFGAKWNTETDKVLALVNR